MDLTLRVLNTGDTVQCTFVVRTLARLVLRPAVCTRQYTQSLNGQAKEVSLRLGSQ